MQQLKNYVMPSVVEIISYCVVAFLLLVLDNGRMIIKIATGADSQDGTQFLGDLLSPIHNLQDSVLDTINPVVVDVVLWSVIGCVIIIIALWLAMAIEKLFTEKTTLSYVSNKKLKQKEILTFLVRLFIRITAFIVAASLFAYFVLELFPDLSSSFSKAFNTTNFYNSIVAILAVLAVALIMYLLVVCLRFVLLKPKIL